VTRRLVPTLLLVAVVIVVVVVATAGEDSSAREDRGGREAATVRVRAGAFAVRRLAGEATLRLTVTNAGARPIDDMAVTLRGLAAPAGGADPDLPRFLLVSGPAGADIDPPYPDSFALGRLGSGETAVYRWRLRALRRGAYRITWAVAPGGGASAALAGGGGRAQGVFRGRVADWRVGAGATP
jgi:hypothetical protein